jgi:hypothetical protein
VLPSAERDERSVYRTVAVGKYVATVRDELGVVVEVRVGSREDAAWVLKQLLEPHIEISGVDHVAVVTDLDLPSDDGRSSALNRVWCE